MDEHEIYKDGQFVFNSTPIVYSLYFETESQANCVFDLVLSIAYLFNFKLRFSDLCSIY